MEAALRTVCRRLDNGEPIRKAMKDGNWTLQKLADRTRALDVDPTGRGVSFQLIAFLATPRPWGRSNCRPRSAELIAAALGQPEEALFAREHITMPAVSAQE